MDVPSPAGWRSGPRAGRVRLRRAGRAVLAGTALLALAGGLTATVGAGAQAQEDPEGELARRGAELFGSECATCHGAEGRGNQNGPDITDAGAAGADFVLRTGRMPLRSPDEAVRHREPRVGEEARDALVAYVEALGDGPAIPDVGGWETADVSRGHEIYTSNCAACHGPTAQGIAVGQRDVSSSLDVASPLEIAEAMRVGPGVMPVFDAEVLPQEDLEAVVGWVLELRERQSPGGISLGRSGPVTEGFIAWLVGLGLLGIVMYLLGEKAGDPQPPAPAGSNTGTGGDDGRA